MRNPNRATPSKSMSSSSPLSGEPGNGSTSFTAIDDCTRLRVLRIYPKCNQKTAIQFLDYLLAKLPFRVEVIQTDNGENSHPSSTTTSSTEGSDTSTSNGNATTQRQSRALPPHRQRRVLPDARRDRHRLTPSCSTTGVRLVHPNIVREMPAGKDLLGDQ